MREKWLHILLIALFAAFFYANSFSNFFVWNDWSLIIENPLVHDWRNFPEIFTSAFWKPLIGEPSQIYRPLVLLSFIGDFSLWRLIPWGYHLTNVSLHVANSILAYLLMRVYVSPVTALIGAVLFAVHPIHTEAVTYISGRGDLLASFFILSGTLVFMRSEKRRSWPLYFASLPLFFLALLAKETAAIFPLLLIAAEIPASHSIWRTDWKRLLIRLIGPLAVLAGYYILRSLFVGMTVSHPLFGAAAPRDFLLALKAVPLYLGLLLFPWKLHFLHPLAFSSPWDLQLLLSIVLLLAGGWALWQAARFNSPGTTFGILWLMAGMLPLIYFAALNVPFLEAWSCLLSVGFVLLAALALNKLGHRISSMGSLLLAIWIAVLLGGGTWYRNQDWKNDMGISLDTVARAPGDPTALRLLGDAYLRQAKFGEAEKIFQEGLAAAPADAGLHRSLGALYRFRGRQDDAARQYEEALKFTSQEPYAYWLLGHYYLQRSEVAEAEKYFSAAVRVFPYSSELHQDLALAYYLQGKRDSAESELQAALRISPYSPVLKDNLEMVRKKKRL